MIFFSADPPDNMWEQKVYWLHVHEEWRQCNRTHPLTLSSTKFYVPNSVSFDVMEGIIVLHKKLSRTFIVLVRKRLCFIKAGIMCKVSSIILLEVGQQEIHTCYQILCTFVSSSIKFGIQIKSRSGTSWSYHVLNLRLKTNVMKLNIPIDRYKVL